MVVLRRTARVLGKILLGLGAFVVIYGIAVWLMPMFMVNSDHVGPADGESIYIRSNGVHTDIVLPLRGPTADWTTELPFAHTASGDSGFTHVAFGWGDKGFYLETQEWADLKVSTALKAAFGLSGSAMHITFCHRPVLNERCRTVRVDEATLRRLSIAIAAGFARDPNGGTRWIPHRYYDQHDAFYEGTGRYGLFFTCNTWSNRVLKEAGLPAALWTATDAGILRHYP